MSRLVSLGRQVRRTRGGRSSFFGLGILVIGSQTWLSRLSSGHFGVESGKTESGFSLRDSKTEHARRVGRAQGPSEV